MREALEYHRDGVAAGELWRLLTGQLVHWSTAMLVADVAVLLVAGIILGRRSPRLLILCLPLSAAAVGAAVHFLSPELIRYRGSSGIASALVVACALELAQTPGASRRAAIVTLVLGAVKLVYEVATGVSLSSGTLPPGVRVAPVAHVAGAASGAVAWLVARSQGSRMLEARRRRARRSGRLRAEGASANLAVALAEAGAGQRGPRERRRKGGPARLRRKAASARSRRSPVRRTRAKADRDEVPPV